MSQATPGEKIALRKRIREALAALSEDELARRSAAVRELLLKRPLWMKAQSVLLYAPLRGEVDVWPLLQAAVGQGKVAALPRYSRTRGQYVACRVQDPEGEVRVARFGIREPVESCAELDLNLLDLVLVPGVAFDLSGRRLGRGRGYYDLLLSSFRGKTCGIAFDEQVVGEVPVEAHDILLNCILTPTRWVEL